MNNNLFGMKCGGGNCRSAMKGYSQFDSVEESEAYVTNLNTQAYVTNLNTHPAYKSFRKSRAQLRKRIRVTASTMIHKLKGYSTKGSSYNNYLFAMYQDKPAADCRPYVIANARSVSPGIFFDLTGSTSLHCADPGTPSASRRTLS